MAHAQVFIAAVAAVQKGPPGAGWAGRRRAFTDATARPIAVVFVTGGDTTQIPPDRCPAETKRYLKAPSLTPDPVLLFAIAAVVSATALAGASFTGAGALLTLRLAVILQSP